MDRVRSGIRRIIRFTSQPGNAENQTRKDSITSSRSGNWVGSSIFGSKLFETASTGSAGSQRINVVAACSSVEPVFPDYYSSFDEVAFPRPEFPPPENRRRKIWTGSRLRTSSASSDVGFSAGESAASLQRTRSLPLRGAASAGESRPAPGESPDEFADRVAELPPSSAAAAAGSASKRKWQMTMPELTEGPENETLTSHGQKREHLAAAALAIIRGEYKDWTGGEPTSDKILVPDRSGAAPRTTSLDVRAEKRRYLKNLLVMSAAYFFLFSAYFALRNLQSSLNAADGLGLYALSSMYCALVFGSLFSTTIVQRLRPKRTVSLSLVGFVAYSAANFHPRFYTMIPASVVHGFVAV